MTDWPELELARGGSFESHVERWTRWAGVTLEALKSRVEHIEDVQNEAAAAKKEYPPNQDERAVQDNLLAGNEMLLRANKALSATNVRYRTLYQAVEALAVECAWWRDSSVQHSPKICAVTRALDAIAKVEGAR